MRAITGARTVHADVRGQCVAKLKKLELAEALGKVVCHEDVMTVAFDTYRAVRDQLLT